MSDWVIVDNGNGQKVTANANQVTFNVPKLFEDVFGVYARFPVYFLSDAKPGAAKQGELTKYDEVIKATHPNFDYKSEMGKPMWDKFGFAHPDLLEKPLKPIYFLPDATVVEVIRNENIVTTSLVGLKGTVKEQMSEGDDILTFKGFIIGSDMNAYPTKQVAELRKWRGVSIPVISKLLNDAHGIYNIVVQGINFMPMPGSANVQPFEMFALSDNNIILDLN